MKLLFVVNPVSGGIEKDQFLREAMGLCDKYGLESLFYDTTGKNDKEKLKEILDDFKPDKVAACGGDGTVLLTSIVLLGTDIPMGIIPLGSANGMAMELEVNNNPVKALNDLIISNVIEDLDILIVNEEYYCMHIGDIGINANIVEAYDKDETRGMLTYAKYFLRELSKPELFSYTIEANRDIIHGESLMIAICNARKFGTGIPLNLEGSPFDGKFEIVVLKDINQSTLIKAGLSRFSEIFFDNQDSEVIKTREAKISFNEPRLLQLDGEVVGHLEELTVKVHDKRVKFITHMENQYLTDSDL